MMSLSPGPNYKYGFAWSGHDVINMNDPDYVDKFIEMWIVEIQQMAAQPFSPTGFVLKQEKRKPQVTSAMQKAIRRGDGATAVMMAEGLSTWDEEYCWRRLPVIAMEEIGVADPMLVAAVLWMSGKKAWRLKTFGSDLHALHAVVTWMATAVKDRSVCDLLVWLQHEPDWFDGRQKAFAEVAAIENAKNLGAIKTAALAYVTNANEFIITRLLNLWVLAGTDRFPADEGLGIPDKQPGLMSVPELLAMLKEAGVPPLIRAIVRMGASKLPDAMPLSYVLVWELVVKHQAAKLPVLQGMYVKDELTHLPKIGYYPSETFDWHCRAGKQAFGLLGTICEPIANFLTNQCKLDPNDKKERIKPIASLVFYAEGALLDKRMMFEGAQDIRDLCQLATNRQYLVPGELSDWAMDLVRANLDYLHYARQMALDVIPVGKVVTLPKAHWTVPPPTDNDGGTVIFVNPQPKPPQPDIAGSDGAQEVPDNLSTPTTPENTQAVPEPLTASEQPIKKPKTITIPKKPGSVDKKYKCQNCGETFNDVVMHEYFKIGETGCPFV